MLVKVVDMFLVLVVNFEYSQYKFPRINLVLIFNFEPVVAYWGTQTCCNYTQIILLIYPLFMYFCLFLFHYCLFYSLVLADVVYHGLNIFSYKNSIIDLKFVII